MGTADPKAGSIHVPGSREQFIRRAEGCHEIPTPAGLRTQRSRPFGTLVLGVGKIGKVHRRGYALDDEEAVVGACCIGVPLLTPEQTVIGAISISGPVVRVTKRQVQEFATMLRSAADQIPRRLSVLYGQQAG